MKPTYPTTSHNERLFLNNLEVGVLRDRFENLTVTVQVQLHEDRVNYYYQSVTTNLNARFACHLLLGCEALLSNLPEIQINNFMVPGNMPLGSTWHHLAMLLHCGTPLDGTWNHK